MLNKVRLQQDEITEDKFEKIIQEVVDESDQGSGFDELDWSNYRHKARQLIKECKWMPLLTSYITAGTPARLNQAMTVWLPDRSGLLSLHKFCLH